MRPEWAAGYSEQDWCCRRKHPYERIEDADQAAQRASRFYKKLGLYYITTYRCPYCDLWHLTRKETKRASASD